MSGVTGGASFVYACPERSRRNGDGNRVKKLVPYRDTGTEGGQTILYVNQYYEKPVLSVAEGNLGTGVVTTSYYLGGKLIAQREGTTLRYIHQDSLSSTSVMSTSTGTLDSGMTFFPFGSVRSGDVNSDKKFTGQRLDDTGLYFYNARYYDAAIGRFISADTIIPDPANPQLLNRYSYVLNNPLKYTDPTGHKGYIGEDENGNPIPLDPPNPPNPSVNPTEQPNEPKLPLEPKQPVVPEEPKPASPQDSEQGQGLIDMKIGAMIFDTFGQIWTTPNTILGLVLATMSGDSSARIGPGGTFIIEGVDTDSMTGKLMSSLKGNPLTVGYVILTKDTKISRDDTEHELGHVTQYAILGPYFLPLYDIDSLTAGGEWKKKLMETKLLPNWPRR